MLVFVAKGILASLLLDFKWNNVSHQSGNSLKVIDPVEIGQEYRGLSERLHTQSERMGGRASKIV